jgi:hypothetical protein
MKERKNEKFSIYPSWHDCLNVIYPLHMSVGTIFAEKGIQFLSGLWDGGYNHQFLKKVTKIEPLTMHPNHLVISSVIVGAIISKRIYERTKFSFWTEWKGIGEPKFAVVKYYGEDHVKHDACIYRNHEKTELFSIFVDGKSQYYAVDFDKLDCVRVPIEEFNSSLGYFGFH